LRPGEGRLLRFERRRAAGEFHVARPSTTPWDGRDGWESRILGVCAEFRLPAKARVKSSLVFASSLILLPSPLPFHRPFLPMLSNADRRGNGRSFAAPTSRRDRWTCATGAARTRAVQNARASDFRGSGRPFAGRTGPRGWWMSSAASAAIPGAARPAGTGPAGCAPSFAVSEGCCDLQRATFGLCVSSKSVVWVRSRIHAQKFAAVRTGEPRKLRWVPCLPRPFFACGQYRCARALGVCELARFSDARRSVVNAPLDRNIFKAATRHSPVREGS